MKKNIEQIVFSNRQVQIINVCIKLIADGGIQNLTTKHIAEQVGVSEPALYRHFKNKLDILKAILDEFKYTSQKEIMQINNSTENSLEKLKKIFFKRIETFCIKPELSTVIFSEEIFQNEEILSEKVMEIMQLHQQMILKILIEAQEKNEVKNNIPAEHLSILIMGSLRLLVTRWRMTKFTFDLDAKSKELWNSIELLIKE
ncbi:MAG: TetR/AcrR family transcriptional regulator [bacterium]